METALYARNMSKVDFARELFGFFEKPKTIDPASMITVYRWFTGKHKPRKAALQAMQRWLESQQLKKQ